MRAQAEVGGLALSTQAEKDDGPTYSLPNRIDRDLELVSKGKL